MSESTILDEGAVQNILKQVDDKFVVGLDQARALCATVRQLRAENEALRKEVANSEKYQAQLLDSDSQAAGAAYICDKCGQSKEHTPECSSPAWCPGCGSRVIGHDWTVCHSATTAMRDKCVETVKDLIEQWAAPDSDLGDEVSGFRIDAANDIIEALEKLTLMQKEGPTA